MTKERRSMPTESQEVWLLRRQQLCVISDESIACGSSSSTSVDRLFVNADVSTDAEEDQGHF